MRYEVQFKLWATAPSSVNPSHAGWTKHESYDDKTEALKAIFSLKKSHTSYEWRCFDTEADHSSGFINIA